MNGTSIFNEQQAANDNFTLSLTDSEQALGFLEWRSERTEVRQVKEIEVKEILPGDNRITGDMESLNLTQHTLKEPYDLEKGMEETALHAGLVLSTSKGVENMLCRETAIDGILSATRVAGRGWRDLRAKNKAFFAENINHFCHARPGEVTIIEVLGKVTGVASDRYNYLPQDKLLRNFLVSAFNKGGEMSDFQYSHEITYAKCDFPGEEVRKYSVDKLGFDPDKSAMTMCMTTSDCRASAARVWFSIKDSAREISAAGVYTTHRGSNGMTRFTEACMSMHTALMTTIGDLLSMNQYQLQYADSTIREIGRRIGLSDKALVEAIKESKATGVDFSQMTAYEAYLLLCNLLEQSSLTKSQTKGFSGDTSLIQSYIRSETKARIPKFDWKGIDAERLHPEVTDKTTAATEDPDQQSIFDLVGKFVC